MAKRVTLRHQKINTQWRLVHFYEGNTIAVNGLVDDTLEDWQIENVWRQGYNLREDGTKIWTTFELRDYVESLNQPQEEQVDEESLDSGRQSVDTNGVRSSEPDSGESVPVEGLEGSSSGGTNDEAKGSDGAGDTNVLPRQRRSRSVAVPAGDDGVSA